MLIVVIVVGISIAFCIWKSKSNIYSLDLEERQFEEYETKEEDEKKEKFGLNDSESDAFTSRDSSASMKRMIK